MSDIISVKDLNLWYGNNQALYDIDLGIPEKSITGYIIKERGHPEKHRREHRLRHRRTESGESGRR